MSPRQRGAVWLLGLLCLGRLLDAFDLPFEANLQPGMVRADSSADEAAASRDAPERRVPARPTPSGAVTDSVDATPALISINHASAAELQALPRVGPVLAARLVTYRETHGPFGSSLDLQRVPGIGARTAAQLAPLLRFD